MTTTKNIELIARESPQTSIFQLSVQYNNLKLREKALNPQQIILNWGFSASALLALGEWIVLRCGGCPVPCRMLNILGFYALDSSSTPSCDNQECLQTLPSVPLGRKSPLVENHCFNDSHERTLLCFFVSFNGLEDIKNITCFIHCSRNRFWILCSFCVIPPLG